MQMIGGRALCRPHGSAAAAARWGRLRLRAEGHGLRAGISRPTRRRCSGGAAPMIFGADKTTVACLSDMLGPCSCRLAIVVVVGRTRFGSLARARLAASTREFRAKFRPPPLRSPPPPPQPTLGDVWQPRDLSRPRGSLEGGAPICCSSEQRRRVGRRGAWPMQVSKANWLGLESRLRGGGAHSSSPDRRSQNKELTSGDRWLWNGQLCLANSPRSVLARLRLDELSWPGWWARR